MAVLVRLRQTESKAQASLRVAFSRRAFRFVPGTGGSPCPWEGARQLAGITSPCCNAACLVGPKSYQLAGLQIKPAPVKGLSGESFYKQIC